MNNNKALNIRNIVEKQADIKNLNQQFIDTAEDKESNLYKIIPKIEEENKSFEHIANVISMVATATHNMNAIGCSANQLNMPLRFFVLRYYDMEVRKWVYFECINPEILKTSNDNSKNYEGCLSFPAKKYKIPRSKEIEAQWRTIEGDTVTTELNGLTGTAFQHELDHLNGITFDMRVSKLSKKLSEKKYNKLTNKYKFI